MDEGYEPERARRRLEQMIIEDHPPGQQVTISKRLIALGSHIREAVNRDVVDRLATTAWPDTYAAHHDKTHIREVYDRIEDLVRVERAAKRYLDALDGRLGPLDYTTPDAELSRLRAALRADTSADTPSKPDTP